MIESRRVSFNDLFASSPRAQVRVPDYQRGYSWENKQVKEFFYDLKTFSDTAARKNHDSSYFLGPIVLMRGSPSDVYYFAVDGQQRLATLIMLLAVIRDKCDEDSEMWEVAFADEIQTKILSSEGPQGSHRWAFRLGDLDQPFFEKFVLKRLRYEGQIPRNTSNGLIKRAWNQLERDLRDYLENEEDKLGCLKRLVDVLMERVVMVAIEVQGERDAMSVFERINVRGKALSESDLIRHRLMSACNQHDRGRLRSEWDNLEKMLGGQNAKIDAFLRDMWISRNGERTSSKLYDEISEYLDNTGVSSLDFVDDTVNDCVIYTELLKVSSPDIHHASRALVRATHATLGAKQTLPLFLAAYRRLQKTPEFSKLATIIEALIVRYTYFANHDPVRLSKVLYKAAKVLYEANNKESALQGALSLLKSVNPTNAQVVAGIQRQMRLKKLPALYILRQIENSLGDGSLEAQATLEHIFPQNATVKEWRTRVGVLDPYVWHIGNMTLLATADNSKASNRSFSYKKKKVYKDSALKITRDICNVQTWGRRPILRRAEQLAKWANQRWKVE